MARGKAHDESVRAKAEALLLAGLTMTETADKLGIPVPTIQVWKEALSPEILIKVHSAKKDRFEDLRDAYFAESIQTLRNQARLLGDRDYLVRYPPLQVAQAHDSVGNNVAGILRATAAASVSDEEDETGAPESAAVRDGGYPGGGAVS